MSDTHSLTSHIKFQIPDGDVFIHAGDFTKCGQLDEVIEFNTWIGRYYILKIHCVYLVKAFNLKLLFVIDLFTKLNNLYLIL